MESVKTRFKNTTEWIKRIQAIDCELNDPSSAELICAMEECIQMETDEESLDWIERLCQAYTEAEARIQPNRTFEEDDNDVYENPYEDEYERELEIRIVMGQCRHD